MPTALIVAAHPEPTSFTQTWARHSADALSGAGFTVLRSDLCAMGFDPVEHGKHYGGLSPFDPLKAATDHPTPPDVLAEVEKIEAADLLVLHFPTWWFGPPAILKGWLDRCLLHGRLHDVEQRFDTGPCRGKRVLICTSFGASEAEVGPGGKEGRAMMLIWPVAYALRYCGLEVLQPRFMTSLHGYWEGADRAAHEAAWRGHLDTYGRALQDLDAWPVMPFHADADFDSTGVLRPGIAPLSPFHG